MKKKYTYTSKNVKLRSYNSIQVKYVILDVSFFKKYNYIFHNINMYFYVFKSITIFFLYKQVSY